MEVLRAENALLRDQLNVARDDIRRKDAQIAQLIGTHHDERMALINGLTNKLDNLYDIHLDTRTQISSQLQRLSARITKAPSEDKAHGFALVKRHLEDNLYELKFISGQSNYVTKKTRRTPPEGIVIPFTENGNGIDLRNRFKERATERLEERLGEVRTFILFPTPSDSLMLTPMW